MQRILGALLAAAVCVASTAHAALIEWQAAVAAGTPAGYTNTNITSPIRANIGTYNESTNGGISYEFIVNATNEGPSSALMGQIPLNPNLSQPVLKWEQFQDKGTYGLTDHLRDDWDFKVANTPGVDTHLVFVNNSVDTLLYVNGSYAATISGVSLTLSGQVGIGGTARPLNGGFRDPLTGTILGVAVYDAALSPAEIAAHAQAFRVPEPTAWALVLLGGSALASHRRRRIESLHSVTFLRRLVPHATAPPQDGCSRCPGFCAGAMLAPMSEQPDPVYDADYFRRKGFTEHPDGWRPSAYPLEPGYTLEELQQYEKISREIEARMAKWPRRRSRRWRPT